MGLNTGDIVRIIDTQTLFGEQVLNVYYYRYTLIAPAGNEAYAELADQFTDVVVDAVKDIQNVALRHLSVDIRNLTNDVDIFTLTHDITGAISGACMTSYNSFGFLLRRDSALTDNGYKRIGGVSESSAEGNNTTMSTALLDAVEDDMAASLNIGILPAFEPVIVKSPIIAPLVSPIVSGVQSVQYRGLGTQNTRKPGRGA